LDPAHAAERAEQSVKIRDSGDRLERRTPRFLGRHHRDGMRVEEGPDLISRADRICLAAFSSFGSPQTRFALRNGSAPLRNRPTGVGFQGKRVWVVQISLTSLGVPVAAVIRILPATNHQSPVNHSSHL